MRIEPMKLAYVVKVFPRFSETFIVNEILAHEAAGHEVEVFSLRAPADTHFQDILGRLRAPVRYLPSEGLRAADFWEACERAHEACGPLDAGLAEARGEDARTVYQAMVMAERLRRGGFTHVHAHFASVAAGVARLAAPLAELPWSLTAHAKDIFHQQVDEADLARKFAGAARVVTVSDFNCHDLCARFPEAAGRITRIYNGLDVVRLPHQRRDHLDIDVLAVGRLVEKKGFDVLIDAVAALHANGRPAHATIVGGGEMDAALRARAVSRGVGHLVTFTGPRPQAEVVAAFGRARVFAAPSVVGGDGNREGLPTTILEAMACGTPVVATATTGVPEVVRHGQTGLLVPEGDPVALAAAIERLLDDPAPGMRMAAEARALIEREFDVHRNARALRDVFAEAARPALQEAM